MSSDASYLLAVCIIKTLAWSALQGILLTNLNKSEGVIVEGTNDDATKQRKQIPRGNKFICICISSRSKHI